MVDKSQLWLRFCTALNAVQRGDVCICTCRTELGGAKERTHFANACTCFGERMSKRQVTALPSTSLGARFGRRREQPSIFPFLARRHRRGKQTRNAKPPRAATHRDQLLESETHTSIKRVGARRKAGTHLPASSARADQLPPRRGTPATTAATNRVAALASFVPLGFFFCAMACTRISCKPGRLQSTTAP